jgi:DNA-binding NarL/FixJ family response regulator
MLIHISSREIDEIDVHSHKYGERLHIEIKVASHTVDVFLNAKQSVDLLDALSRQVKTPKWYEYTDDDKDQIVKRLVELGADV